MQHLLYYKLTYEDERKITDIEAYVIPIRTRSWGGCGIITSINWWFLKLIGQHFRGKRSGIVLNIIDKECHRVQQMGKYIITTLIVPAWDKGSIRNFCIFHDQALGSNLRFQNPEIVLEG